MTNHITASPPSPNYNQVQLSKILELSADIICTFDIEGQFTLVSDAATNIWGYTPDEIVGKHFLNFIHPEDYSISAQMVERLKDGISTTHFENRYIRKDGSIVYMIWSARWDNEEKVMYCIARDGSEALQTRKQLELNEQRLKNLVQDGSDMIAILDLNANYTYKSPSTQTVTGRQPEEFIGRNASEFIHPDDVENVRAEFLALAIKKRVSISPFRFQHKDGSYRWIEAVATNLADDPAIGGIVTNSRDITERLKAVEKLKENEAKLTLAAEISKLGYWQHQPDGTNRYWSDEVYNILGLTEGADLNNEDAILNIIHPDDLDRYLQKQSQYLNTDTQDDSIEYRIICPDGSVKWVCETGRKVLDDKNQQIIVIGTVQDITAQKLLALSLEESNKRYAYATQATFDSIWDWNLETNTHYLGEGYERTFGYKLKELKPDISTWTENIHPNDLNRVSDGIYSVINGTETNWSDEYLFRRANGTYAYVIDKGFVIRNEQGKAIRMVGAMQDISDRKNAERELKSFADDLYKRNKELHEFGYIVSHNLRSPVANIMGIANLLEMDKEDADIVEACARNLKTAISNLDTVIKDLSKILSLTDGSVILPYEQIDLHEMISSIKTDLAEVIKHADAVIEFPKENLLLLSHKAYLYSVFYNLISNAIKYRSDEPPVINIRVQPDEEATYIYIRDNGTGIDLEKHGNDLFKPYRRFNTTVKGKGLGLFLVKSHIEAINGQLQVESQVGVGTTFTITLPLT